MKSKDVVKVFSIGGITVIETVALFNGIDGTLLGTSLAVLGGIAGYHIKERLNKNVK